VPEGACIGEDCLVEFETIRDDFASLDDWGIAIAMSSNSVIPSSPMARRPTMKAGHAFSLERAGEAMSAIANRSVIGRTVLSVR
jgi:hypothetical protein